MNKARLLKLATHLEIGKLIHAKFDFSVYNIIGNGEGFKRNGCGTLGCAIGECPAVFKRDWRFLSTIPLLRKSTYGRDSLDDAHEYFDIDYMECEHLFVPDCENFGCCKGLSEKSTAKQVARHIRKFVKMVEANK